MDGCQVSNIMYETLFVFEINVLTLVDRLFLLLRFMFFYFRFGNETLQMQKNLIRCGSDRMCVLFCAMHTCIRIHCFKIVSVSYDSERQSHTISLVFLASPSLSLLHSVFYCFCCFFFHCCLDATWWYSFIGRSVIAHSILHNTIIMHNSEIDRLKNFLIIIIS